MGFELPEARSVAVNPTQAEMRAWTLEFMPRVTETEFGNLNYQAETKARLTASTFFVSDGRRVQEPDLPGRGRRVGNPPGRLHRRP